MLHQKEIDIAKNNIKEMVSDTVVKHWTKRPQLIAFAHTIHNAHKHLRLTERNTQSVVDALAGAVQKGIITDAAKKHLLETIQQAMMDNNIIVENEFIKKQK
ncbi:hypothetical protein [Emticicia sp. W12TSBA100-4]|uniref:hypothetical protein n=1 Tax=Emticicia sp. W12TSBA100-4 TaxID=3160965 RepID=UPI0033061521